jgi:hypothetical protein
MRKSKSLLTDIKFIEATIYVIIWLAVFSIPFFKHRIYDVIQWDKVYIDWIKILALLIIFILNIVILVPKFLFTRKYYIYFTGILLVIMVVISLGIWSQLKVDAYFNAKMPPMEISSGLPMELSSSMPAPQGYRIENAKNETTIYTIIADYLIFSILLIGASTTLKIASRWITEENLRRNVEQERLKTELALLRHQVSPHFLMNTLNNIHSLIDINVDTAKDAIIKLSILMRYLLYDSAKGRTTLKKELEFIESYISLMKLRYPKKVSIKYNVPRKIPETDMPAMLFISFLENAFKHGVSYQAKSFVAFRLEIKDDKIICIIRNSKHSEQTVSDKKYSGIGLSNIKKNLELLYKDSYSLRINDSENEFEVRLILPL